jgi:hypothetical protein
MNHFETRCLLGYKMKPVLLCNIFICWYFYRNKGHDDIIQNYLTVNSNYSCINKVRKSRERCS